MEKKLQLAVLNSHGDSCSFNSVLDSVATRKIDAEIILIICSSPESFEYAKEKIKIIGISPTPTVMLVDKKQYRDLKTFNDKIDEILSSSSFDLIVLAGYLQLFRVGEKYKNKVINLHPALFRTKAKGQGAYGKKVYGQVLKEGLPAGATVHFADDQYDHGKIILEKEVPVAPNDTSETLRKRICEEGTKIILPRAIQLIAEGKVKIKK